ncbi:PAQR family membrane homeostasis protein TrhA [Pannonibacter indicus]|uniref:Predicted membrane channel-forming protein YqfA, hemolysin III family n=1 Tax=Pannonibacter indicus TaxID=466044 RepID=A0A0K6I436_9HYPH|nr:hemolysin III family protein [Pannonibacter indicus]CUA97846.1 Predicted membrane channel-forming protein YqfA, hemolysin III family [Pannonibacter indicus]
MREQTRAERIADGTVHVIGIALGVAATIILLTLVIPQADAAGRIASISVYTACLMAMLICSALYNMLAKNNHASWFRRFDHAAIFLMIAGTYTPFAAMVIGGWPGMLVLAVVWTGAITGATIKLVRLQRFDKYTVPICLALGWVIVFAYQPLLQNASPLGFWLLVAGGALYSAGTAFYAWKSLPFQNAIWHGFVLAAAICHFGAILSDVALTPALT